VTDLRQQLESALGHSYSVERELGGGGMSRVFLATETALGRKVVVKVLPPEMAAGVNIERFRREITLAAGLQHPHIVPLHAAGQAGDIFYYTMPLVEGESLRAKLAREGELPIGETVRILRDVADALAYAHTHGVVHRDIKPDNVLISGHHAVVTDFGVAKAVSAASGESSLTSLGVALGTPAYMAPEQAAADPHVDHRADLYALGAMAYEMLCGRPPFTGMSASQVLAAHVTLAPDPVSTHRSSVPPALNVLVMRLLEKKPADRVQTAQELATTLEAMATPTGGTAPTGATPSISSGSREALRRSHPRRTMALFAVAAIAVLLVVYVAVIRFGLPWWVLTAAVGLMAIGAPIMYATGRAEHRRVLARTTGITLPPEPPAAHFLTWNRAIMGGVVAFASLTIVAVAYSAMRVLGIGPVGTLVASGALAERQPIVLADFENRTRDSTLGPTLTEAFRVDLSQSPTVRLVDPSAVSEALTLMRQPEHATFTPALAREVATRGGMKAIVTGQIDPVGRGYVLAASVVAAADGRVLTAVRESAADDAGLIPALDKLSRQLRERIGESLVSIRANEPLADVTTSSLEALRDYSEAVRIANAGDEAAAVQVLREAIRIDTGFAMAYRKLAAELGNTGASQEEQLQAATKAFEHRDRLPDLERAQTEGYYYDLVYDLPKAAEAYRSVLRMRPDDDIALNNLGIVYMDQRQFSASESLFTRTIATGAKGSPYVNLVITQSMLGKFAAAESTVAAFSRSTPNNFGAPNLHAYVRAAQFDFGGAERLAKDNLARVQSQPHLRQEALEILGSIYETQGQLSDAESNFRQAFDVAHDRGLSGVALAISTRLADLQGRFRNRPDSGLAIIGAALRRFPLDSMAAADRPYVILARYYVSAGKVEDARRMMADYERLVPDGLRRSNFEYHAARGDLAFAAGKTADAITYYHDYREKGGCGLCGFFELGEVYRKTGQRDSARVYYEKRVNTPAMFRVRGDAQQLAATYQRLGELAEERGDKAAARDWYGRLLDLWKKSDPELQPLIKDLRGRLASLGGPG